jgi:hypothetical protein
MEIPKADSAFSSSHRRESKAVVIGDVVVLTSSLLDDSRQFNRSEGGKETSRSMPMNIR